MFSMKSKRAYCIFEQFLIGKLIPTQSSYWPWRKCAYVS